MYENIPNVLKVTNITKTTSVILLSDGGGCSDLDVRDTDADVIPSPGPGLHTAPTQ